jgi:4-amino-4-deoxy-L-arabinose transferase-like glycosyltransferase
MRSWHYVAAIVFAFIGLSTLYNLAVPIGEAPDEPSHIQYIEIILRSGQLPTIPVGSDRYSYEAEQPPLYYLLEAGWIRLFWPSNKLAPDLQGNPDFSFDKETPYNAYLQTYSATYTLPVHLLRLFSTLLGVLTLLFIWLAAREIWPETDTALVPAVRHGGPSASVLAVGFAALLPGFTFTSGTVTNDTLAAATGAAVLFFILRVLRRGLGVKLAALTGVVLGLGVLSKWSLIVFAPIALLACILAPTQSRSQRLISIVVLAVASAVIGSWPFLANLLEYGDPFATSARLLAKNEIASPLAHIPFFWIDPGYLRGMLDSLWGVFGLRNLELPSLFYLPYYLFLLLGLLTAIFLLRRGEQFERRAMAICLLAVLLIYAGVAWQNTQFWAIQGRLLLPGLGALALIVGRGLDILFSLFPSSTRRTFVATSIAVVALFALNVCALVAWLIPAYYKV